jgi:hypothetical protein
VAVRYALGAPLRPLVVTNIYNDPVELVNKNSMFQYIFFINLEIIQLKLLKDLAQISLPADADKRRKNKCKKTLTWFFAKLCTAAPVTVEEKKNRNGR